MTEGQASPPFLDVAQLMRRAFELHRENRLEEAGLLYRQVLVSEPADAHALHMLGVVEGQLGRREAAVALIGRAVEINPADAMAHYNLGNALRELHRFEEALSAYDRALALRGDDPATLNNRGAVLDVLQRPEQALLSYERAIAVQPSNFEAHHNRGNVLLALARYEEAAASYGKVLALSPSHDKAWFGRGKALLALNRLEDALTSFGRVVAAKPDHTEAHIQRANIFIRLNNLNDALRECDNAIAISPYMAYVHEKRGDVLLKSGRGQEAYAAYDRAHSLNPDLEYVEGARLFAKMHVCDWNNLQEERERLISGVRQGRRVASPFDFLVADVTPREHLACARAYAEAKYPPAPSPLWIGQRYHHAKIRLGYVSGEFRDHASSFLTAPLFECHDRTTFELHAISTGFDDGGAMRPRLKNAFDAFHDTSGRTDREIAELIRQLEIDILVNLNGYTGGERTGVFALKPSPSQVSYLGFPGTMGAPYMDYIFADRYTIPEDQQPHYTEKVVYLPDSYQADGRQRPVSERAFSRAEYHLPQNGFVFCSFNNTYKITPLMFDIWMRLLAKTEGSVLWLLELDPAAKINLRNEAQSRGVDPDRIVFTPFVKREEHLARAPLAGLFLDTLPINAGTTASDALWMGVPVLTCVGSAFTGRVAASLLSAVGLEELITQSLDEYKSLALSLARDPERLARIRARLARNRDTYPLFDTPRFTRHIEAAYKHMWERQQQGLAPIAFSVVDPTSST